MITDKNLPEGALVYAVRRGLEIDFIVLMEIEERRIVKRTPTGYKLEHGGAHRGALLYKDADYYLSTDREAVAKALLEDCRVNLRVMKAQIERLEAKKAELVSIAYPKNN